VSGFASARTYAKVGVQTDVLNSDPHRLILILFDGALHCIRRAKGFLAEKRIAEKCDALSQACQIVDSGLRVSVDPAHDPQFAGQLVGLYNFVTMRLLQANLRNDVQAMDDAIRILEQLRTAWVQIAPGAPGAAPAAATAPAASAPQAAQAAPAARRALSAYQA
jgi:flagellar protein FliS